MLSVVGDMVGLGTDAAVEKELALGIRVLDEMNFFCSQNVACMVRI
jgi:hypothetical protein